ncbi:hypothetical protein BT96DRAFT_1020737 [Gymnopus androsaceus JB14]|uniref:Ribosomal RNA methyltransferase FtsJ domain-containing protein n=1 Tax=Gymnopus androsaceus JB14 TaxID=1447944 RepID=A0A6A4HI14_9AGAR|nr:hypothetical protein BT96DRAFT_1020737 [Gymnopus androsaceus JB14]
MGLVLLKSRATGRATRTYTHSGIVTRVVRVLNHNATMIIRVGRHIYPKSPIQTHGDHCIFIGTRCCLPRKRSTEELIACGAKELKEIFEIWDECCQESRRTGGAPPSLVFQPEYEQDSSLSIEQRALQAIEERVFEDIVDRFSTVFPFHEDEHFSFLDIGCRPGGFASFIMRNNPKSSGVGIAHLPEPEDVVRLEYIAVHQRHYSPFGSRFKLHFCNISKLKTRSIRFAPDVDNLEEGQCEDGDPADLEPPDFLKDLLMKGSRIPDASSALATRKFNLIVIDAISSKFDSVAPSSSAFTDDLLLISQLLVALQCTSITPRPRAGGTIVVRLTHPESINTAKILYMLDIISGTVATLKPRDMDVRGNPESFYAIAQDVGGGPHGHRMFEIIEELKGLYRKLLVISESTSSLLGPRCGFKDQSRSGDSNIRSSYGSGPSIPNEMSWIRIRLGLRDLDFLAYTEDLIRNDYMNRLASLGELVWTRQLEMILLARRRKSKEEVKTERH